MSKRDFETMPLDPDDQKWRSFLRALDPVTSPSIAELTALESQILSRAEGDGIKFAPQEFYGWMVSQNWLLRSVCLAAALFILLGFLVGRDFDNLAFQSTDPDALIASADGTPWQSFIMAPLSQGESDDSTE